MKRHIPNAITCLNLATGALACFYIIEQDKELAIYFVMFSALFDFMDGFVARLLKVQSAIGKELDSLADVVSFGLVPAVYLVMCLRGFSENHSLPYLGLLVVTFSAIRLAKFNTDNRQTHQFIGLPTPANAIMITSLSFLPQFIALNLTSFIIITILSSLLLVANIPLIALKFNGTSWKANQWKYVLLIILAVLFILFGWNALPLVIPVYLLVSLFGNYFDHKRV